MLKIIAAVAAVALSGCASLGGNAFYTYTKTATGCTLRIDSGRQLPEGFDVQIGPDCSVGGSVGSATQGAAAFTMQDIQRALQLLQILPTAPTAPATEQPKQ